MNVYDKAHELARAFKESGEFKEVRQANDRVSADPDAKRMLEDFRGKQMELQQKMMTGEMPPKDEMEKMEKQFEVINMNTDIRKLFEAERRLSVVMEDIQKIIAEPLQDIFQ
jgi:cell fate (sporulation/competence/biofilm development) regulator YlbF (YheA/YmcA/DUF963 family)